MLATSITERTCGGLASALSEQPRGLAMLEEVAHRGLFLQRIDDDPDWFRYHQLFAEFLRHRLARDDPERSQRLHRTAAAWFAEHGYLNEAVNHALAVDDATLAVDLVEHDYDTSARGVENDDASSRLPRSCRRRCWHPGHDFSSRSPGRISCCSAGRPPTPR